MAAVRTQWNDAAWFLYGDGDGAATIAFATATTFTVASTDVTAVYHTGRRIRAVGSTTGTIYGTITGSTFSTNTTVTVLWDSGELKNETLTISLSIIPAAQNALPGQVGRNLIHNGAMTVAQRGTSFPGLGGGSQYTLDQWATWWTAGTEQARFTISQDSTAPAGFGSSLKIDCTTAEAAVAVNESNIISQRIEAQNLQVLDYGAAGAKSLTLSFWFRSPKTGIHCVSLYQGDGNRSIVTEFTVAVADTFEYFSVTFPGDAAGTINNDTGRGLDVAFPLTAGSNYHDTADAWASGTGYGRSNQQNLLDNTANNIYITGVQLEVGSVATDFEHEDIAITRAKCERRLQRWTGSASSGSLITGNATSTTAATFSLPFRQKFASTPAFSRSGTIGNFKVSYDATSVAMTALVQGTGTAAMTHDIMVATVGSAVLTVGGAVNLRIDSASDWVQYSCEL
jgi:hypothetical protein